MVIFRVVCPSETGAESKVCQLDVAGGVDQDVVRFDVPVNEAHAVDTLNRAGKLRNVKSES